MREIENSRKSGAGTDDVYSPKLWCFDELSFLNDGGITRTSQSNIDPDSNKAVEEHNDHELYGRLTSTSVVAFIDLKSAFDVANREVILDQLVDFGVTGNLLGWVREYLRNRTSRVLFKGASSTVQKFELGTPQGRSMDEVDINESSSSSRIADSSGSGSALLSSS
ncbi:hypothetical protein O3P69_020418 [Scylla paramamosain]|uniref:Reverse transcriptase domain-containing protein n=1 Tax=Scylla paramamosain TaxID=85552 RepID=A0AAW0TP46_SCYPA